jgi:hypothetical protein
LERVAPFTPRLAARDAQIDQFAAAEKRQIARGERQRIPAKTLIHDQGFTLVEPLTAGGGANGVRRFQGKEFVAMHDPQGRERTLKLARERIRTQVHGRRFTGAARRRAGA